MSTSNVAVSPADAASVTRSRGWEDPVPFPTGPGGPRAATTSGGCNHDVSKGETPCVNSLAALIAEANHTADLLGIPRLRIVDDAARDLPDSTGEWTPEKVAEIAHWAGVAPAAHAMAHNLPIAGCPGCPQGYTVERRDTEQSWRELEDGRRPLGELMGDLR